MTTTAEAAPLLHGDRKGAGAGSVSCPPSHPPNNDAVRLSLLLIVAGFGVLALGAMVNRPGGSAAVDGEPRTGSLLNRSRSTAIFRSMSGVLSSSPAVVVPERRDGQGALVDPLVKHVRAPFASLLPTPADASGAPLDMDPNAASWIPNDTWRHGVGSAQGGKYRVCVDGGAALWRKDYSLDNGALLTPGYCFGRVAAPELELHTVIKRVGPERESNPIQVYDPAPGDENRRAYAECEVADLRLFDQYPTCFAGRYWLDKRLTNSTITVDKYTAAAIAARAALNDEAWENSGGDAAAASGKMTASTGKAWGPPTEAVLIDGDDGCRGSLVRLPEKQNTKETGRRRRLLMSKEEKSALLTAAADATSATPAQAAEALGVSAVTDVDDSVKKLTAVGGAVTDADANDYVKLTFPVVNMVSNNSGYMFPNKMRGSDLSEQTTMYFAKESPAFCPELAESSLASNVNYVAYMDEARADVWWPYAPTLHTLARDFAAFLRPHSARRPIAAFVHKHCGGTGMERAAFVQALALRFPVHSLGQCHPNREPWDELPPRGVSNQASQATLAKYMFFFALESVDCDGYTTEKVWEVLSRGSIPVFYGSDDIYKYLPDPNAILDVKKFDSVDALAERMRDIATDPREFAKMRAWRVADPVKWPDGFKRFLATGHVDIRARVCGVLRAGGNPRRDRDTAAMGGADVGQDTPGKATSRSAFTEPCRPEPLLGVKVPTYFSGRNQVVLPRRWPGLKTGPGGTGEVVQTRGDHFIVPAEAHFVRTCADEDKIGCYMWRDAETTAAALLGGGGESFLPNELGGTGQTVFGVYNNYYESNIA